MLITCIGPRLDLVEGSHRLPITDYRLQITNDSFQGDSVSYDPIRNGIFIEIPNKPARTNNMPMGVPQDLYEAVPKVQKE